MMLTTLPVDASSTPTTLSFNSATVEYGVVATATNAGGSLEFVIEPKDLESATEPEAYRPIDEYIVEQEQNPRRKAALERARARLAETAYSDEGITLRTLRLKKGLSQERLAQKINSKQPYIARIEQGGQSHNLTLDTCRRLADALNVDLTTLDQALRNQGANTQEKGRT